MEYSYNGVRKWLTSRPSITYFSAAPGTRKTDTAQTIDRKATVIMWWRWKGYEAAPFQSSIPTKILTGLSSIYRANRKVLLPRTEKYSSATNVSPRRMIAGSRFWDSIRPKVAENVRHRCTFWLRGFVSSVQARWGREDDAIHSGTYPRIVQQQVLNR